MCQISLGDGRYAYGRVLCDASIAVYRAITQGPGAPPIGQRDFLFPIGVYEDNPGGARSVVGHDALSNEEDQWPPPYKVVDPITGSLQIYVRGEIRPAENPAAAQDLEKAAVWNLDQIIERVRDSLPQ